MTFPTLHANRIRHLRYWACISVSVQVQDGCMFRNASVRATEKQSLSEHDQAVWCAVVSLVQWQGRVHCAVGVDGQGIYCTELSMAQGSKHLQMPKAGTNVLWEGIGDHERVADSNQTGK